MTIHLGAKHQVTLPKQIVQRAHLVTGDPLEVVVEDDQIILRPLVPIPREQAYFWSRGWQAGEREADEDRKAGRTHGPFQSTKAMRRGLLRHDR